MADLQAKERALRSIISKYEKPCIAFSGGVDSTLLLVVARAVKGDDCVAVTARGVMLPARELEDIAQLVRLTGCEHHLLEVDVFSIDDFRNNTPQRCYACKKEIFGAIKSSAQALGCDVIFDGSNIDDLSDYRPGMKALAELGVVSPFLEAQFTKAEIRTLSQELELMTAKKPALACLASRIPTGTPITPRKLAAVEAGEALLRELKLNQYRLRHLGDTARLECAPEDFDIIIKNREALVAGIKKLGFKSVVLDLCAYTKGAMNHHES